MAGSFCDQLWLGGQPRRHFLARSDDAALAAGSGKPITERQMASRPGYTEYVASASGFYPRPPRIARTDRRTTARPAPPERPDLAPACRARSSPPNGSAYATLEHQRILDPQVRTGHMEEWERLLNELRAELTLREQELDLLHTIDLRLLDPNQDPQELFSLIVRRTQRLLQANHTSIMLRRSTYLEPMYSNLASIVGQRVPISKSLAGQCLEFDMQINAPDLADSAYSHRYAPLRGYRGAPMNSLLATPIKIRGTVVGVLNAESRIPNTFKPVHERISSAIAAQIAIALQRTQTLDSTVLFADVDRMMFANDDTPQVIQAALEKVMAELQRLEHVQHTRADILFVRGHNELEIMHSTTPADVGLILHIDKSVSGRAVRERQTVIVGDVRRDSDYQLAGVTLRSEIAVPILFGEDDTVIGVLNVESEEEDAFYGFYQIVLESFAEKVKTFLAFAKLRADVTEALELRSASDLLAAVGDQTSHMIHRLNNTVGAMRLRIVELQDMRATAEPDYNDFLDESLLALRNLAERTLKMPDEVTQMLRPEGATVDVNDCVKRAIAQIDLPDNVLLDLDLDESIPPLPLYCFDIVVQNLLQNGLDAMPSGGRLTVSTWAMIHPTLATGYFQIVIKDTGIGISSEIRGKVFELNFSTKHARGRGLGLGLWWVRNFVRRARGDITIRSSPGSGTEVIVKIPIDAPSETSTVSSR
jgi:signal transduction histidine kinase